MKIQKSFYIETYGCQMNVADTEVVMSIMDKSGYGRTTDISAADVILVNTCAVRENAEQRIYGRIGDFRHEKIHKPNLIVGVLGCMAERLRKDLLKSGTTVDLVVGPDEYRRLPELIEDALDGSRGIAVRLSRVENYDDIVPLRTDGLSAWVSVMRGCDKFCTFCVVPFTRGRERSRSLHSVVQEVESLVHRGFREVTLLGQNVNSYFDPTGNADFADLLAAVADVDGSLRVRFTTSHPQDMSVKLIETIARRENICKYVHLPVQSGSDRILTLMNRTYSLDHYRRLVETMRSIIPDVSLSTDLIAGFPTETEDDHASTLELIEEIQYDGAYTFKYSPRENTKAWHMGDDVSDEVKVRRLSEIIDLQRSISLTRNRLHVGQTFEVLVEGTSKRSENDYFGRTDSNKTVIFPRMDYSIGDYVRVSIDRVNAATLFGTSVVSQDAFGPGLVQNA